jgi:MFS superfamily sulfate permease-like transporter
MRVESALFFANADYVRHAIRVAAQADTRTLILDCQTTPGIDVTATEMLVQLAHDLDHEHIALFIAADIGQVRDVIRAEGRAADLGQVYPTVDAAVGAARARQSRDPRRTQW